MSEWRRHAGDSAWHRGAENAGSFVTLCSGRWSLSDEVAGEVEHNDDPPHHERCEACQRVRIDELRIEEGLRELRDSSTYAPLPRARVISWPEFDLSDVHGGES